MNNFYYYEGLYIIKRLSIFFIDEYFLFKQTFYDDFIKNLKFMKFAK